MQIAIDARCIQDRFPGIGRYTFGLVKSLTTNQTGLSLNLVVNPRAINSRFPIRQLAKEKDVKLIHTTIPTLSFAEQWRYPLILRKLSCDAIHFTSFTKPYVTGCRSLVTVYDLIPLKYPGDWTAVHRTIYRIALWQAVKTAQQVVTVSESSRRDLVRLLSVPEKKISVIPPGVDSHFRRLTRKQSGPSIERYGLHTRYALYLGSDKHHKNLKGLLQAWEKVRTTDVILVCAGFWNHPSKEVKNMLQRAEQDGRVFYLGPIEESALPSLYSAAEAFIFPSLYEGFGLPILEAMACETPVICSRIPSLSEISGNAALQVNPSDSGTLAERIDELLNDRNLQQDLRERGLHRARKFTWNEAAAKAVKAYESVVGYN